MTVRSRSVHPSPVAQGATLLAARGLIAALFVVSGLIKAAGFVGVTQWMGATGVPAPSLALALALMLEIGGGVALALGWQVRRLVPLFIGFVVLTSLVFHPFWATGAGADQLTHFLKNLALVGALLLLWREAAPTHP